MNIEVHEIKTPLYGIYIHYSNNKSKILKQYEQDDTDDYNGFCCYDNINKCIGIHIPHENGVFSIPTLAHEVFHAAMKIGSYVGLEPTLDSNEEIAYLIGWLTGWVLDCIDSDTKTPSQEC